MSNRLAGSTLIQDPDAYGLMAKIATLAAPDLLDSVFRSAALPDHALCHLGQI